MSWFMLFIYKYLQVFHPSLLTDFCRDRDVARGKASTKFQFVPKSFPWELTFLTGPSACLASTLPLCHMPSPVTQIFIVLLYPPPFKDRQSHTFCLRMMNLKQALAAGKSPPCLPCCLKEHLAVPQLWSVAFRGVGPHALLRTRKLVKLS